MARKFGIITSVENLQAGIVVNSITRKIGGSSLW